MGDESFVESAPKDRSGYPELCIVEIDTEVSLTDLARALGLLKSSGFPGVELHRGKLTTLLHLADVSRTFRPIDVRVRLEQDNMLLMRGDTEARFPLTSTQGKTDIESWFSAQCRNPICRRAEFELGGDVPIERFLVAAQRLLGALPWMYPALSVDIWMLSLPEPREAIGQLSPAFIQRVTRGNYDAFRDCYLPGLARNANLRGRVRVRYVIDAQGRVRSVENVGSDLPDPEVVECVGTRLGELRYPWPTGGGVVTVVYPIMFEPGR